MKKTKNTKPKKLTTPAAKSKAAKNSKPPKVDSTAIQTAPEAVAAMTPDAKTQGTEGRLTKLVRISELLKRPEGATLDEIIGITDWQKHTVRAFISHTLAKKHGYQIVSEKPVGGQRIYKIAEPAQGDH